mmetsp:Transcript_36364/g.88823  ORF Transcript_36364/g.88823 Transcript_36364/m.88823 type:complete len:183 (+) Transcript_36364:38-586(+)
MGAEEVWAVGNRVRLRLSGMETDIEGYVYTDDASVGCVVLQNPSASDPGRYDVQVVRKAVVEKVTRIEGDASEAFVPKWDEPREVNWGRLRQREAAALQKIEREQARINANVTAEVQAVFDALAKTLPCRWDGDDIVVMDVVRIRPPYGVDDAASEDEPCLARVRMILDKEIGKKSAAKTLK